MGKSSHSSSLFSGSGLAVSALSLLLFAACPNHAKASGGCSSPSGVAGQLQWISANGDMEFCNGTNWVSMLTASTATTCSTAGLVTYKSSLNDLQFCDGSYWNSTSSTLTDGTCTAASAGQFNYVSRRHNYEFCNGTNWIVTVAQPTLNFNFMSGQLPVQINFSNPSAATPMYFNSLGTLTAAPVNLIQYSQALQTSGSWTPSGTTITGNAATAPDGSVTAAFVQQDSSTGQHMIDPQNYTNLTAGQTYTFSVYAAAGSNFNLNLLEYDSTDGNLGATTFNLSTGTITSGAGTISSVGNGWYRCAITFTPTVSTGINGIAAKIFNNAGVYSYAGDGSSGLYLWGAQLETGSAASNYITTTSSAAYGPRFDYDPVSLTLKGLLMEESRQNLELSSAVTATTPWQYGCGAPDSTSSNPGTAPDGSSNGLLLTHTGGACESWIQDVAVGNDSTPYTASIFVKGGTATSITFNLWMLNGSTSLSQGISVNLTTGTITSNSGATSAGVIPAGNGWYRIWLSYANNSTGNTKVRLETYLGTGTTVLWGAQLEAGTFPSSYIPTTSAAAVRGPDMATVAISSGSWFNASAGTFYVGFIEPFSPANPSFLVDLEPSGASGSDRNGLWIGGNLTPSIFVSGAQSWQVASPNTLTFGQASYGALAYQVNNCGASLNGATAFTSNTCTLPSVNLLRIGHYVYAGADELNGWFQKIQYFPKRLTNSQLQQITTTGLP